MDSDAPNRLLIDGDALVANWRALASRSGGAACGAAIKADGYGLGVREVAARLVAAGCRDLFVATWAEAAALGPVAAGVSVLHGVRAEDMAAAAAMPGVRPVLSTPAQVLRWRENAAGRACDVMVDTGMNRLGVSAGDIRDGLLGGLAIDTLMSHLACADDDGAMNGRQAAALAALAGRTSARRLSLANSAGIALGAAYRFDLTRPGIALYGGVPRAEMAGWLRPVVRIAAQVLQVRPVPAGGVVGYNATWTAPRETRVAVVNLGYADGYPRSLSNHGRAYAGDVAVPVIGRVSMDLVTLDASAAPALVEGGWVTFDADLTAVSRTSGRSPYEVLTGLGRRFDRVWR